MEDRKTQHAAGVGIYPLVIALLGLQLVMIFWFVSHAMYWSDLELDLEEDFRLLPILIPLLLGPVFLAVASKASRHPRFHPIATRVLLPIGLACQVVLDWLLYAWFHRLPPFPAPGYLPLGESPTGWLSSEATPLYLFGAWLNFTCLLVIPTLFGLLSTLDPRGVQLKQSWHVGAGILGMLLAFRWGGPWSFPLYHLAYTAAGIPCLASLLSRASPPLAAAEETGMPAKAPTRIPFLPSLGFLFHLAWWFSILETQSGNLQYQAWLWVVPGGANLALYGLSKSRQVPWEDTRRGRMACIGVWAALVACTICVIFATLSAFFAMSRTIWLIAGSVCAAFFPEQQRLLRRDGNRAAGLRLLLGSLFFLVCAMLPLIASIYDPLSSYIALGLAGGLGAFTALGIAKSRAIQPASGDAGGKTHGSDNPPV